MNNSSSGSLSPLSVWAQQLPPKAQMPWVGLFSVAYFAWFYGVVGLRAEHTGIFSLLALLYLAHPVSRQFLFAFTIFLLYVIVFDSLRVFPNYLYNTVHIKDLYLTDKALFGVYEGAQKLSLNEFALLHTHPVLDVLSGLFYVSWVPVPIFFATYLFFHNKLLCLHFLYGFVLCTFISVFIYYLYPAAPPWYVADYGFDLLVNTRTHPAGLLNFDHITGIPLFTSMYSNGPMPFAAMPSKHAAFPLLCYLYGRKLNSKWLNAAFFTCTAGIWLSAIYTGHHYVLDVLAGGAVAIVSYLSFERVAKTKPVRDWFNKMMPFIGGKANLLR